MQSKHFEKYTTLKHNNQTIDMNLDTYARWLCLLEGVDLISKKMKQFGHKLKNQESDWIKPLAFQKYINERYESMKFDIQEHDNNPDKEPQFKLTPLCTTLSEPALK